MTLLKIFVKSAKKEGEGIRKIPEKILYLRRDTFVDIPLEQNYESFWNPLIPRFV